LFVCLFVCVRACVRACVCVCVWITVTYYPVCATGPDHWADEYPACAGKFQSPIDIEEHLVRPVRLPPLAFRGFNRLPIRSTLTNNGHTGESIKLRYWEENKTHVVETPHAGEHEYDMYLGL